MTKSTAARVFELMPAVQDTLGYAQFRFAGTDKAKLDTALLTLSNAAKIQPLPSIYLHLAMAYEKKGDPTNALKSAGDGVRLATAARDPILPELLTIQERLSKVVVGR